MRFLYKICILFFILLTISTRLNAQGYYDPKEADQFFPDFKADKDMVVPMKQKNPAQRSVQYGGWIMPTFVTDHRGSDYSLSSSITTANAWLKAYLWDNAFIYIRAKDTLTGVLEKDGYSGLDDVENLFDLDIGYLDISFANSMLKLQMGRKFFILGTGLVFNGRGDGLEFDVFSQYVNLKVFGAYTGLIQKENNLYQLSDRDYSDGARRIFTGGEIWFPFENQEIYLLAMAQFDMSDETAGAREKYNSQYYGGGIRGLIQDSVSYYGEYIYETGTTFTSENKKRNIRAMAATLGLDYYIQVPGSPVFIVQYAFASGDRDRDSYADSNINPTTGCDTGFMTFGTFLAGYALRPLPGNIHVFRGGFALSPLNWMDTFYLKRLTIIAKYSYYMKDKKEGTINEGEATDNDLFIGHGVDVSLRWEILSDLSFFASYALFLPGDAFPSSENNRHFIAEGIILSF